MKDSRKQLLIFTILLFFLMFGFAFIRDLIKQQSKKTTVSDKVSMSPTNIPANYEAWPLFRNGYSFPLPPKWQNTSDTGGTAVLEPGKSPESKIGTIQKISVTIVSDAKASPDKIFTTQSQFDEWHSVKEKVEGSTKKLKNILVENQNAIELLDTRGGYNKWMIIVWVRKDNVNMYLSFSGNQKYTLEDIKVIDYIVSHFTFIAPTMKEGEDKK